MVQRDVFFICREPGALDVQILDEDDLCVQRQLHPDDGSHPIIDARGIEIADVPFAALERARQMQPGRGDYFTADGQIWDPIGQRIRSAA